MTDAFDTRAREIAESIIAQRKMRLLEGGIVAEDTFPIAVAAISSALREAVEATMGNFSDIRGITLGERIAGKISEQDAIDLVNSVLASMRASAIRGESK